MRYFWKIEIKKNQMSARPEILTKTPQDIERKSSESINNLEERKSESIAESVKEEVKIVSPFL